MYLAQSRISMSRTLSVDMKKLPYIIHEHVRTSDNGTGVDVLKKSKSYPRMERVSLAYSPLTTSLGDALSKRTSLRSMDFSSPISIENIGTLLHHALGIREDRRRRYPSGGAVYPIETYLFIQKSTVVKRGAYHYQTATHALEHLWDIPDPLDMFSDRPTNAWADAAPLILTFTAVWESNCEKYGDFGYYLGMLEAGHMAQNVLLVATALNLSACPLGRFNDAAVTRILDLNTSIEQPLYAIAVGHKKK